MKFYTLFFPPLDVVSEEFLRLRGSTGNSVGDCLLSGGWPTVCLTFLLRSGFTLDRMLAATHRTAVSGCVAVLRDAFLKNRSTGSEILNIWKAFNILTNGFPEKFEPIYIFISNSV